MSEITFRDFAGAMMGNDSDQAATHLQALLGLGSKAASDATAHFASQMKANPAFMMKAAGMRTVVQSKDRDGLVTLLGECFALDSGASDKAADALMARYS